MAAAAEEEAWRRRSNGGGGAEAHMWAGGEEDRESVRGIKEEEQRNVVQMQCVTTASDAAEALGEPRSHASDVDDVAGRGVEALTGDVGGRQTYRHTCIHTYMHACMHTYIHTYIRIYVYTYIHTCTYAIHTHTTDGKQIPASAADVCGQEEAGTQ